MSKSAAPGSAKERYSDSKLETVYLAADKKKWRRLSATLVLIDEAGFTLVSALKRSWGPRGQTPTARTSLDHHQHLNLFGALLVSPRLRKIQLSTRSFRCNLCAEHTILFWKQLLRLIPGQIVLVWDRHKIHISPKTEGFLQKYPRVHIFHFPTCAPELNPVEFVWTQVSEHNAGFAPHNLQELVTRTYAGVARTKTSKKRLLACLKCSELSWK